MEAFGVLVMVILAFMALSICGSDGAVPRRTLRKINVLNREGPYIGLVIPNTFEMNPLLESPSYIANTTVPHIDFAGKRFRFGTIESKKVILVMSGLAMINAGITTQLLLSLFNIVGIVHYGIAGNANPSLNIGDVVIPQYWAHTGLWNWQRYGDGPEDELALEVNGDYTRDIGFLKFSNFTTGTTESTDNTLNNIWYQPEEVFPVNGTAESREHIFWVPVDGHYFNLSKTLEDLKLENCLNSTTCLSTPPKVATVVRGVTANIYLDNAAYRSFIYNKFRASPVEMESTAIALLCYQHSVPYIVFRALSDLAGGGAAESNEAATFTALAAANSVTVVIEFIKNL